MDNYTEHQSGGGYMGLVVTLLSTGGAVYHFIEANVNKSNASFALGVMASAIAMIAGIMTIREKIFSIKVHKQNLKK